MSNWYKNYIIATTLRDLVNMPSNKYNEMSDVDKRNFQEIYQQPAYDIEDDTEQPGFVGSAIEDETIKGYLYGYEFIVEDNMEDFDIDNIVCYDEECKKDGYINYIKEKANNKKILYVSNLAIDQEYRGNLLMLVSDFLKKVRSGGFEYMAFEALSDSYRLMFKNNTPREELMKRFGLKIIGRIPTGDSHSVLVKVL